MAIATGYNTKVYYIEETTYGTTPTADGVSTFWRYLGTVTSAPYKIIRERSHVYGVGNQTRQYAPILLENYEFSLEVAIHNESNWRILKDIGSGKSYTFAIQYTIGSTTYYAYLQGVYVNSFSLSTSVGELITASLDLKVRNQYTNAGTWFFTSAQFGDTNLETLSQTDPSVWADGKAYSGTGWTTSASSDITEVQSFTVEVNLNMQENRTFDKKYVDNFYEGRIEVSGSMTCNFDSIDHLTRLLDNESGSLRFYIDTDTYIEITGVRYDDINIPASEQDLIMIEISFTGNSYSITA